MQFNGNRKTPLRTGNTNFVSSGPKRAEDSALRQYEGKLKEITFRLNEYALDKCPQLEKKVSELEAVNSEQASTISEQASKIQELTDALAKKTSALEEQKITAQKFAARLEEATGIKQKRAVERNAARGEQRNGEKRPYCEICDKFAHTTLDCPFYSVDFY